VCCLEFGVEGVGFRGLDVRFRVEGFGGWPHPDTNRVEWKLIRPQNLILPQKHAKSYKVCVQEACVIRIDVRRRKSAYLQDLNMANGS
jgi:hypothetical protein